MEKKMNKQTEMLGSQVPECSVTGCPALAKYSVLLCDLSPAATKGSQVLLDRDPFLEQDYSCPYLCEAHAFENEARARGIPRLLGSVQYPLSNRWSATGFTLYLPIGTWLGFVTDERGELAPFEKRFPLKPYPKDRPPLPRCRCDWSAERE